MKVLARTLVLLLSFLVCSPALAADDVTPPVIVAQYVDARGAVLHVSPTGSPIFLGEMAPPIMVSLAAADETALDRVEYAIHEHATGVVQNGRYTGPVTLNSNEGYHTFFFIAVDRAGNASPLGDTFFNIKGEGPEIQAHFVDGKGQTRHVTSTGSPIPLGDLVPPVTITLTATDDFGVAGVQYAIHRHAGPAPVSQDYRGPIVLNTHEGGHTIHFDAWDRAGTPAKHGDVNFNISGNSPTLSATFTDGSGRATTLQATGAATPLGEVAPPLMVALSANDDFRVAQIQYTVVHWDTGSTSHGTYSNPIRIGTEGWHSFFFTAVDDAGNRSPVGDVFFNITVPVIIGFELSPSGIIGGTNDPVSGKLTLSGPAPQGGLKVKLTPQVAFPITHPPIQMPDEVLVPAGETSVTFSVLTEAVLYTVEVALQADSGPGSKKQVVLTVNPPPIPDSGPLAEARVNAILYEVLSTSQSYGEALGKIMDLRNSNTGAEQDIYLAAADHYLVTAEWISAHQGSLPTQLAHALVAGSFVAVYELAKKIGIPLQTTDRPTSRATVLSVEWGIKGIKDGIFSAYPQLKPKPKDTTGLPLL